MVCSPGPKLLQAPFHQSIAPELSPFLDIEARPRCQKCQKVNATCQYGIRLQWFEDSVARGIRHGRQGVWRSKRTDVVRDVSPPSLVTKAGFQESPSAARYRIRSKGITYFLNTSSRDVQLYWHSQARWLSIDRAVIFDEATTDEEEDCFNRLMVARPSKERQHMPGPSPDPKGAGACQMPTPPIWGTHAFANRLSQTDEYVLNYYTAVVCPNASLVDNKRNNPARYLILPMAAHSHIILNAMLAVSGVRLAYRDTRFHHRTLVHRQRVLADLKCFIQDVPSDTTKCLEALIAAVMLCWYEVS